jgi:hypothetical protein
VRRESRPLTRAANLKLRRCAPRPGAAAQRPRAAYLLAVVAGRLAARIPLAFQEIRTQPSQSRLPSRGQGIGSNCVGGGERVTCAVLGGAGDTHEVFMRNALPQSILIKRFAAKRLYDVDLRRYVLLDDLYAWQVMAVSFIVEDAKSGEDVTAAVLADATTPGARSDPSEGPPPAKR